MVSSAGLMPCHVNDRATTAALHMERMPSIWSVCRPGVLWWAGWTTQPLPSPSSRACSTPGPVMEPGVGHEIS